MVVTTALQLGDRIRQTIQRHPPPRPTTEQRLGTRRRRRTRTRQWRPRRTDQRLVIHLFSSRVLRLRRFRLLRYFRLWLLRGVSCVLYCFFLYRIAQKTLGC